MVRRTLKLNDQIKQLAADLKDEQSCLMFGRGRNYATAMEAADDSMHSSTSMASSLPLVAQ